MARRYESTNTITKVLCTLGFRSRNVKVNGYIARWADFCAVGVNNSAGERTSTHIIVRGLERKATRDRLWELREEIERLTEEAGFPFYVRKQQFGNTVDLVITNSYVYRDDPFIDLPFGKIES